MNAKTTIRLCLTKIKQNTITPLNLLSSSTADSCTRDSISEVDFCLLKSRDLGWHFGALSWQSTCTFILQNRHFNPWRVCPMITSYNVIHPFKSTTRNVPLKICEQTSQGVIFLYVYSWKMWASGSVLGISLVFPEPFFLKTIFD